MEIRSQIGSNQHLTIITLLAESYMLSGWTKEALTEYEKVLDQKDSTFKEAILSLTLSEKFQFYRTVGDLYEKCEVLFEAIVYYEKAYEIFEKHPDIDVELIAHLDVLNGLIFIFKKQGLADQAFYYANTLHLINKALDPNHPNTFNSCLTLLKLLKEKKEPLTRDQRI
jgi:tetratricopeptide (TPR) repeat protein